MAGERWRIVVETDKERRVTSGIYATDELNDMLALEATLHGANGWSVASGFKDNGDPVLIAKKNGHRRLIYAQQFDPMEDQ